MMFENLLIESDLKLELDGRHSFNLKSIPDQDVNALELKVPSVVAGVALLRQSLALGEPDRQFSWANKLLSDLNVRVDVVFLGHKLVSVGKGASQNALQKLLSTFPMEA